MIHENSRESYDGMKDSGEWKKQKAMVLKIFVEADAPLTDRRVNEIHGTKDMNWSRPKITEFIKEGSLVQVDKVKCSTTKRTVRRCGLASRYPQKQMELGL